MEETGKPVSFHFRTSFPQLIMFIHRFRGSYPQFRRNSAFFHHYGSLESSFLHHLQAVIHNFCSFSTVLSTAIQQVVRFQQPLSTDYSTFNLF